MKLRIETSGMAKALRDLADEVTAKDVVIEALTQSAEPMRQAIERYAPRGPDAPHIAENIVISSAKAEDVHQEIAVAIGPARGSFGTFFYGFFIEFGTKYQPARPFVRPGFDTTAETVLKRLAGEFWSALARATAGARSTTGSAR